MKTNSRTDINPVHIKYVIILRGGGGGGGVEEEKKKGKRKEKVKDSCKCEIYLSKKIPLHKPTFCKFLCHTRTTTTTNNNDNKNCTH